MDLDDQIMLIQRSCKTLFKVFLPLHEWLKMKSRLYYAWSVKPYSRIIHWAVFLLYISSLPVMIVGLADNPQNNTARASTITYDFPRWESVNPKPTGNYMIGQTTCSDGIIWMAGSNGTILKSIDNGASFSQVYSGVADNLSDIKCYSPSNIIAVGDNGQILQYNGSSWTSRSIPGNNKDFLELVVSSSGLFVAVGIKADDVGFYGGSLVYSTDGISWFESTGVDLSDVYLTNISISPSGRVVATGLFYSSDQEVILYSENGRVWSSANIPDLSGTVNDVSYSSSLGIFMAFGSYGTALYSVNGASWSIISGFDPGTHFGKISITSSGRIFTFASNQLFYSDNGLAWSQIDLAVEDLWITAITASSDKYLMLGRIGSQGVYYTSNDGVNWSDSALLPSEYIVSVAVLANDSFLAWGGNGQIYSSLHGDDWELVGSNLTNEHMRSVSVSPDGKFLAVGGNAALYSEDGINWSKQATDLTTNYTLTSAMATDAMFVLAGIEYGDTPTGKLLYSANGIDWQNGTGDFINKEMGKIIISPTTARYVLVGSGYGGAYFRGYTMYSDDGITWNDGITLNQNLRQLNDIAVSQTGRFVVVGDKGIIYYSDDGENWLEATDSGSTTSAFNRISVSPTTGRFVAVGDDRIIYYSDDGSVWHKEANLEQADHDLRAVTVSSEGRFVAVAVSGEILYSNDGIAWVQAEASFSLESFRDVTVMPTTGQFMAVGMGILARSPDGINWSRTGINEGGTMSKVVASPVSNQYIAVGDFGQILRYYSPTNSAATNFLIQAPGQDNFSDDSTGITGLPSKAYVGKEYKPKIISVENYTVGSTTRYRLAKAGYLAYLSSNDPNASNSVPFNLNNNVNETCDSGTELRISKPCGIAEFPYVFHTAGQWRITAHDAGGSGLTNGISSNITVLPGDSAKLFLSSDENSQVAGRSSSQISINVRDLYDNITTPDSDLSVHLSARSTSRFSTNSEGPWTDSLDITMPAGERQITANGNSKAVFYFLDYAPGAVEIQASSSGLSSASLGIEIQPGPITPLVSGGTTVQANPTNAIVGTNVRLDVALKDDQGNNVSGKNIKFYSSRGETIPDTVSSDGRASSSFTATRSGMVYISAYDETDNIWLEARPTVTFGADKVDSLDFSVSKKTVTAGELVNFDLQLFDRYLNLATNTQDKISFESSDLQLNLPSSYSFTQADQGKHNFSGVSFKSAGQQTVTATDANVNKKNSVQVEVLPSVASASTSKIIADKYKLVLGKDKANISVSIYDAYNNAVTGLPISLTFDSKLGTAVKKSDSTFEFTPSAEGKINIGAKFNSTAIDQIITIEVVPNTLINNIATTLQNSPVAKAIAKIFNPIVASTVTLGLIPLVANVIGGAPAALHALNYGVSLVLEAAGIKKRRKSWGRVYDSTTGKGIDLALVRLYNQTTMKLVGTIVTNIYGKYNFQPQPGTYVITVTKEGFVYPTQIFAEYGIAKINKNASRINNQYLGQPINITDKDNFLNIDIPIDPVNKKASFMLKVKIVATDVIDLFAFGMAHIFIPLMVIGTLMAAFVAIVQPGMRNMVVSIVYLLITLIYTLSRIVKGRQYSIIYDATTGKAIPGVVVSIFDKVHNTLKETRVTDKYGRFSIYAQPGSYYLKADKSGWEFDSQKVKMSLKRRFREAYTGQVITLKDSGYIRYAIYGEKK